MRNLVPSESLSRAFSCAATSFGPGTDSSSQQEGVDTAVSSLSTLSVRFHGGCLRVVLVSDTLPEIGEVAASKPISPSRRSALRARRERGASWPPGSARRSSSNSASSARDGSLQVRGRGTRTPIPERPMAYPHMCLTGYQTRSRRAERNYLGGLEGASDEGGDFSFAPPQGGSALVLPHHRVQHAGLRQRPNHCRVQHE